MYPLEGLTKLNVGELVERVEIGADCAGEKDGILWDNSETCP